MLKTTTGLAVLHGRVEPNSKLVSNTVLPPCQSRTLIMNLVRHNITKAFEMGLSVYGSMVIILNNFRTSAEKISLAAEL